MASKFQDMPPPGGYRPITWEKVVARTLVNAPILFGGLIVMTTAGVIGYYFTAQRKRREKIEVMDTILAVEPIYQAERDREFLKQIRRNTEDEAELMKNVPGWKVGTWFGDPVYKTVDNDPVMHQTLIEYYSHSQPFARVYRHFLKFRQ